MWIVTGGAVLFWWLFTVDAAERVDLALKEGTVQTATVTRIEDSDDSVATYVTIDGREYALSGEIPIWDWGQLVRWFKDKDYEVGDRVQIALDLQDPSMPGVYDVARYDRFSWTAAWLGLAFMLGLLTTARQFLTRKTRVSDGARWQWWRCRTTATVTVVEVRERRPSRLVRVVEGVLDWFSDHDRQHHHLVLESNGRTFFWEAKSDGETLIKPGDTFEVFGRLRHRGWIVALTEPALYPVARLD